MLGAVKSINLSLIILTRQSKNSYINGYINGYIKAPNNNQNLQSRYIRAVNTLLLADCEYRQASK
jgi:hypothetical protein